MGKIEINWKEILGPSSPDRRDVYFAASPSAAPARAAAAAAKGKGVGEFAGVTNNELRREIARSRSVHPEFEGFLRDGGKDNRRRRAALEAEARRRGLDTAAKAGDDCKRDARSAANNVYTFEIEDEQGGHAPRKYCLKSSPVCSTKKNYGQLGITTRRSLRQIGRRKPISEDKMYSSKPCSTTLSGHQHRIHAIDPEEAGNEKCQQNENNNSSYYTKRRKAEHQNSSLLYFQKVQDVVLLDDEDVQPEEPVDCGVPDKWTESKIYYPSRDDPEAVELTSSDIKCLDPGVYLSSPVINYYIQYIKRTKLCNEDCRGKFHIFNTYFYSKLREALLEKGEFSKFRRWWKGVNIFHRGYIILPIHGMAHWSLIIICIPAKESNSGPIILHLDSLGMHPSTEIFDIVGRFLEAEWFHLRKNPPDISISETIWEDLPRNIREEKVQVPRQNNEYDCGIFMLYYIERFIREAPERFTSDKLDMFSRSWFKSEDASELRHRIRVLLLEEFESARLDDAMSEAYTSDRSDDEDGIKHGESEAATASDSTGLIVEGGDTGMSNKDTVEVGASEEAPSSICRSDDKITDCVLSEAATFSDSVKDEEDSMKAESDSSKTEQEFAILSSDKSKNNEGVIHRAPVPDIVCDSSDSDMDDVKIIEVRNTAALVDMKGSCPSTSVVFPG